MCLMFNCPFGMWKALPESAEIVRASTRFRYGGFIRWLAATSQRATITDAYCNRYLPYIFHTSHPISGDSTIDTFDIRFGHAAYPSSTDIS